MPIQRSSVCAPASAKPIANAPLMAVRGAKCILDNFLAREKHFAAAVDGLVPTMLFTNRYDKFDFYFTYTMGKVNICLGISMEGVMNAESVTRYWTSFFQTSFDPRNVPANCGVRFEVIGSMYDDIRMFNKTHCYVRKTNSHGAWSPCSITGLPFKISHSDWSPFNMTLYRKHTASEIESVMQDYFAIASKVI